MRLSSAALLAAAALAAGVPGVAPSPLRQQVLQQQEPHGAKFNPLEHMSGIAPYHDAPGADISHPKGCRSLALALLIRHSSIVANDDEWEDYMEPFVQRLDAHRAAGGALPDSGRLAFLREWQSPINNDNLEQLTQPGAHDATVQGRRLRKLHPHLFPPTDLGRPGAKEALVGKVKTPFKVWTASSDRDIETSKAWIRGAFPEWQRGDDGEGDGKFLTLVKVPNKNPDWGASLTPHKVCKNFDKGPGKPEARQWLEKFGPRPLAALRDMAPEFPWELNDVIAVAMLCGYESVIKGVGKTEFCSVLQPDDFRDFGYWNDIIYHHFVGYKSPLAPYLGMPWLNTSLHNLEAATTGKHPHLQSGDEPAPIPPNATHTQFILPYFTHREEPPVVIVALGLMNQTAQYDLPLDHNPPDRVWHTSHVLPFLGHVGIERLTCDAGPEGSEYIRVIINGAVQHLEHCQSGPGKSCPMEQYKAFIAQRMEQFGDIEGACGGIKT